MNTFRWDDDTGHDVLRRHAAEDLHFGVYDSYAQSLRIRRNELERQRPQIARQQGRLIMQALCDERPLVPHLTTPLPDRRLLTLYRIHPSAGILVRASGVAVAFGDMALGNELQPAPGFTDEQVNLQLDHLENMANHNLYPRLDVLGDSAVLRRLTQ